MRGLRKQEEDKFERFFSLVQAEAEKNGCVFFCDAGDGHEEELENTICEDLSGWLIPEENAECFEKDWNKGDTEKWDEAFFCFAIWELQNEQISIRFE